MFQNDSEGKLLYECDNPNSLRNLKVMALVAEKENPELQAFLSNRSVTVIVKNRMFEIGQRPWVPNITITIRLTLAEFFFG